MLECFTDGTLLVTILGVCEGKSNWDIDEKSLDEEIGIVVGVLLGSIALGIGIEGPNELREGI